MWNDKGGLGKANSLGRSNGVEEREKVTVGSLGQGQRYARGKEGYQG